ncbi:MAG: hypothetical protein WKF84_06335 [Pyrinomonadaceae bacterium]
MSGSGNAMSAAFLDLSTGEFRATQVEGADAWTQISSIIEAVRSARTALPRISRRYISFKR